MPIVQFFCPSCQAPLRLENRALFVGRSFACPDCGKNLAIEADGAQGVRACLATAPYRGERVAEEVPSRTKKQLTKVMPPPTSTLGVQLQPRLSAWDKLSRQPALLGGIVAALFAASLLVVVFSSGGRTSRRSNSVLKGTPESAPTGQVQTSVRDESVQNESKEIAPRDRAAVPQPEVSAAIPAGQLNERSIKLSDEADKPPAKPKDNPPADAKVADALPPPPAPEEPDAVEIAPKLVADAVEIRLRQKIARFDQSKPVPFVKLLDTLEDLVGVPIVWDLDSVEESQLQTPVTITLAMTTVGEILDAALKQVGLERNLLEGRIELRVSSQKN